MKKLQKYLQDLLASRSEHARLLGGVVVAVVGFGLIGLAAIQFSSAETYSVQSEAENGTLAGNYTQVPDAAASAGNYIKFGGGTTPPPPTAGGIKLGVAVEPDYLDDQKYADTLVNYKFDSLTGENAMKFAPIEPNQGEFNWDGADKIVDFAMQHNMRVRGHTFGWYIEIPGWVNGLSNDAAASAMQNHIKTIMTRYKGKITQWDVVNEAFEDDGSLRSLAWRDKLGDDYMEKMFKWAREADPTAELCYNDFGTESAGVMSDGNNLKPKSDAVYNMVKDFKARGVPIDCVGLQTHSYGDYPGTETQIQENIKRLGEAGVKVEITELDATNAEPDRYAAIGRACKNAGPGYCTGVTMWALDDGTGWRGGENAHLFDANLNVKPAYTALVDAIGHAKP